MRWTLAIGALILFAPCAWGQDDAQKLFDAMQQKLVKAKAYKCEFDSEMRGTDKRIRVKGTLLLAAGNRLKVTAEIGNADKKFKVTMVSDGKVRVAQFNIDGKDKTEKPGAVPDKFGDTFTLLLTQGGVAAASEKIDSPMADSLLKVSGFKSAGKEKVDDRQANVIEYELVIAKGDERHKVKLWIDTETNLPLKRVVEIDSGPNRLSLVETYRGWELEPKLADDAFALPK